ncbi:MAG: TatD family hydrolase [Pseudomonadota bacterium]|nr:TatD family hydrolase [Pseudomonadota bacterium]
MHQLTDSHVHLDNPAFDDDRDEVIRRASIVGVNALIVPATNMQSWAPIKALCLAHASMYPAFGLHPMFLENHAPPHVDALSSWLENERPVAVGEIGLDFHQRNFDPDLQREYFVRQLRLALKHDLPVIVHARAAMEEVTLTMRRMGPLRGVVHSFSGSEQQAENLWKLGFHLGIGGPVTYERAQRLRRIVANMPLEYLLLESDAPDQPNAAHRGERNEPARLTEILRCIASLRHESEADIASATSANARKLFHLD